DSPFNHTLKLCQRSGAMVLRYPEVGPETGSFLLSTTVTSGRMPFPKPRLPSSTGLIHTTATERRPLGVRHDRMNLTPFSFKEFIRMTCGKARRKNRTPSP